MMNSLLKSVGNKFPLGKKLLTGLAFFCFLLTLGCKSKPVTPVVPPSVQVREALQDEVSLKADRESLAQLRQEIPEQKRQLNDELAFVLQLMGQVKLKPSEVQSRYQTAVLKRRELFRGKLTKLRDHFRQEENSRKQVFFKKQTAARDDFSRKKAGRDSSREFYAEQERLRQEFTAVERDRRQDFESEISTQSKDFDSYMREKLKEFNEQHQLYTKRYQQVEKERGSKATAVPLESGSSENE